ncbi:Ribonuclease 3 [Porphyridium purpureum]|uniref:Ribonuclease 3 n=1 Tax=Porphyridium purpureum TaxID=35688 RepID=A0A5J4YW72_PORPP|nr:Ribonuclease 3 [Porphyridium purpureum]|eukprot:POR5836..scf227_4
MENSGAGNPSGALRPRCERGSYTLVSETERRVPPGSIPRDWAVIMADFPREGECIARFEARLAPHFCFEKRELLLQAFTHSSAWTHPVWIDVIPRERQCYVNLECMGDAVLRTVILDELTRHAHQCLSRNSGPEDDWHHFNERWLTLGLAKLCRAEALTDLALELEISGGIMAGEDFMNNHDSDNQLVRARNAIMGDVLEAIIGCMYFDQGFEKTKQTVSGWLKTRVDALPLRDLQCDARSRVQEMFSRSRVCLEWETQQIGGPAHSPTFCAKLVIDGQVLATAMGSTKRQAIDAAATEYMQGLEAGNLPMKASEPKEMAVNEAVVASVCKGRHPLAYVNEITRKLLGRIPEFEMISQDGQTHRPTFVMSMIFNGVELARAAGTTKKLAKEQAACIVVMHIAEHGEQWIISTVAAGEGS